MTTTENSSKGPQFRSGPLIASAALVGAGTLLALAGFAVGASHLASAIRRWVRDMEVPPSEIARQKWTQAKAAAAAGTSAWQDGLPARQASGS